MTLLHRSDEYAPEKYKPLRPGQRKVRHVDADTGLPTTQRSKKRYGSLTRDEIKQAVSALPLRPPGK